MKKNYIIPASKVHNLQAVQMMALSTDPESVTNPVSSGDFSGDTPKLEQDARQGGSTNIWENEW